MGQKILVTILMLVSTVSFAQHERYQQQKQATRYAKPAAQEPQAGNDGYEEIETVENNLAQGDGAETSQVDDFKGSNSASNTDSSPQINIYNANSNANKQKAALASDAVAEGEANVDTYSQTNVGDGTGNYASDIKNSRKNLEYKTDEKVIEKLEWSRIEDEKDRADRLFGNRLDKKHDDYKNDGYEKEDEYKKPAVVVVEKPAYEVPNKAEEKADYNDVTAYSSNSFWQQAYIAPMIGVMNTSASNVSSDMSTGLAFGSRFATNFSVEGSFLYSDLTMDSNLNEVIDNETYASFKSADQYTFGLGVAYHFNQWGMFVPKIAGLLGYTYREFDQTRFGNGSGSSTAVDAGIGIGADMMITKNVSIGAELRWMSNMSYSRDNSELDGSRSDLSRNSRYGRNGSRYDRYGRTSGETVAPLEEASYQMFLVNGKFNF